MVLNNAGQVTEAMLYSAYGTMSYMGSTPAGTENTKEKFTGKEFDKEGAYGSLTAGIGAYCLGVRMYDPEIAMFMSCDPKSQYWSPYSYCGDNPLRLVDPSGKNSKDPQDSTQDSTQLDSLANGKKVTVSEDEEKELRKQAREYAYLGGELTEDQIFELLRNRKLKEKEGKAKEGEAKGGSRGISDENAILKQANRIGFFEWVNNVREQGKWDLKYSYHNPELADLGNQIYGATGTLQGIPSNMLLRAAGTVQMLQHSVDPRRHPYSSAWGTPWGGGSFGDDPRDQAQIMGGIMFVIT